MEFTGERFVSTLNEAEISYEHWHRYLFASSFVKDKVVLDIASGDGYGSHLLSKSDARMVIGVDIAHNAVQSAKERYTHHNLEYVQGSIASIPAETASIDVLVSFETIEHVDSSLQIMFLKEIKRVLKADGILIISTPDKLTYSDIPHYKNEFHVKEFYVDEFLDFLRPEFKHIELLGQKIFTASYIWPEIDVESDGFREYNIEPTDNGFAVSSDRKKQMLYALAICSNKALSESFASLLVDKDDLIIAQKNEQIATKIRELAEKDTHLSLKDNEIAQKDLHLKEKDLHIEQKTAEYAKLRQYLLDSQAHIGKLEERLRQRSVKFQLRRAAFVCKYLAKGTREVLRLARHNPRILGTSLMKMKELGLQGFLDKIKFAMSVNTQLKLNTVYDYKPLETTPKISVVMPVYNVDLQWLTQAVESVLQQAYDNYELIIVDDGSTKKETLSYLQDLNHEKIVVHMNSENQGISGASNQGVALATGEYVALLDNDDLLRENALYEVASAVNACSPEVMYSDEAKIDALGNKKLPFLKPDWSPDLLRSQMYIGHLLVFKKALFDRVGGFNSQFDGSQDYDLMLRFAEQTTKIYHIPQILYFWREIETSTAMNPDAKPACQSSGMKALDQHLKRVYGHEAQAAKTDYHLVYDARYGMPDGLKASIIIPTKDHADLLAGCINSILSQTDHNNYEIIIMNNNSKKEETFELLKELTNKNENIRVIEAAYPFNWSKINNHGASHATGNVLVFLNNDTIVINPEWLTRICENAIRKDIGVVGGLLLYEDDNIQHAGVVVGMGGWADHVFKGLKPVHLFHPFISPMITRNVSSVTGACLGIARDKFDEVGGFNEDFIICGSDVELALKTMKSGYYNLYSPYIKLYHLESKSRTSYIPDIDFEMSRKAYSELMEKGDPYYNRNLSLESMIPVLKDIRI